MCDHPHCARPVSQGCQELSQDWVIGITIEMTCRVIHTDELLLIRWLIHDLVENNLAVPLIVDIYLLILMLLMKS